MYRLVYIILYMLYKLIRKSFRLTTVYIYRECIQIHVLLVLHIDDIQYKSNVNNKERHLILLYTIFQISALYLPLFGVGGGVFLGKGGILTAHYHLSYHYLSYHHLSYHHLSYQSFVLLLSRTIICPTLEKIDHLSYQLYVLLLLLVLLVGKGCD